MVKKSGKNRLVALVGALISSALLLSACENASFNVTIDANGKVQAYVTETVTPMLLHVSNLEINKQIPVSIAAIQYTFAAPCRISSVVLTLDKSMLLYQQSYLNIAGAQFQNGTYSFSGQIASTGNNNTVTLDGQLVLSANPCVNPGSYTGGGRAYTSNPNVTSYGFDRPDWSTDERALAVHNIAAGDWPYFLALVLTQIDGSTPSYLSAYKDLFRSSVFDSLPDGPWVPGRLTAALNSFGIQTYRTKAGYTIRMKVQDSDISQWPTVPGLSQARPQIHFDGVSAWDVTLDYGTVRDGLDHNGVDQNYGDGLSEGTSITRTLEDETDYLNVFKVQGVILSTNGTFKAKDNSVTFSWKGWGTHATKTAVQPTMKVLYGHKISFGNGSKSLTAAAKKILKNAKAKLTSSFVTIAVMRDGRITNATKLAAHNKLLTKRANAIKAYLKSLGMTATISISYFSTANANDEITKAAVNRALVYATPL